MGRARNAIVANWPIIQDAYDALQRNPQLSLEKQIELVYMYLKCDARVDVILGRFNIDKARVLLKSKMFK
jgi:hypothetical protein